uniref:Nedd4 family interacting protein 2 n=1 Tax=Jaculus jaculus TaxID=51337 RepID=A0A8C5KF32_JACJA
RACAPAPSMLSSARRAGELRRAAASDAELSAEARRATGSAAAPERGGGGGTRGGGRGSAEPGAPRKPDPQAGSMEHHQLGTGRYQVVSFHGGNPRTSPGAAGLAGRRAPAPETDPSPPPYSSITVEVPTTSATEVYSEFYPVPPPYSVATSLPTYDEAEKAKAAAMAAAAAEASQRNQEEECPPRDDFSDADQRRVGNDGMFMLAFFMAFIFNWLGFCLSFCITNTIAGRYGAICGFGLSLIKWILIVRFSDYFAGYFNGQYWLWWIFLVLGLLLFLRGFVNYLKIRNMSESMAAAHRVRYFYLL